MCSFFYKKIPQQQTNKQNKTKQTNKQTQQNRETLVKDEWVKWSGTMKGNMCDTLFTHSVLPWIWVTPLSVMVSLFGKIMVESWRPEITIVIQQNKIKCYSWYVIFVTDFAHKKNSW